MKTRLEFYICIEFNDNTFISDEALNIVFEDWVECTRYKINKVNTLIKLLKPNELFVITKEKENIYSTEINGTKYIVSFIINKVELVE